MGCNGGGCLELNPLPVVRSVVLKHSGEETFADLSVRKVWEVWEVREKGVGGA